MACGAWCHVALPLQLQAPAVGHAKVGAAILPRLLVEEVWVLQKDLRELVAVPVGEEGGSTDRRALLLLCLRF